jgi:hypothetical protein
MHLIRWGTVATLIVAGSMLAAAQHLPVNRGIVARAGSNTLANVRPESFGTIQGNALNSTNGQLPNQPVRLRDARFGRVVETQVTDRTGLFTFKGLDPGTYIVELVGDDQTILAASQFLNINAGEAISAVVKLPFRLPPFAGILDRATTTAAVLTAQAAASSVLAVTTVGEPTCPR